MSAKIKIVIGVVLLAVVIVLAIGLLSGGDDDADKSGTPPAKDGGSGDGGGDGDAQPEAGSESPLRTVSTERRSGPKASLANGALINAPREIYLRVSAAPKQAVKGTWSVTCGKLGTSMDSYEVTPPSLIRLELPGRKPKSCAVGSSAQLTGTGRLKTAILTNR